MQDAESIVTEPKSRPARAHQFRPGRVAPRSASRWMSYGGVPPPPAIQLVVFACGSNENSSRLRLDEVPAAPRAAMDRLAAHAGGWAAHAAWLPAHPLKRSLRGRVIQMSRGPLLHLEPGASSDSTVGLLSQPSAVVAPVSAQVTHGIEPARRRSPVSGSECCGSNDDLGLPPSFQSTDPSPLRHVTRFRPSTRILSRPRRHRVAPSHLYSRSARTLPPDRRRWLPPVTHRRR